MRTDRIDKFVAYLNESLLTVIPPTLVIWRGDECLEPLDVTVPEHIKMCLAPSELVDLEAQTMRDVVRRSGGDAVLHVWPATMMPKDGSAMLRVVGITYEDPDGIMFRSYPVIEGPGGVISVESFTADENANGRFIGLLPQYE